jgi:hypothetical protein
MSLIPNKLRREKERSCYGSDLTGRNVLEMHILEEQIAYYRAGTQEYDVSLNRICLSMFTFANVFLWAVWILGGTNWHGYMLWYAFAASVFLLGGGILNFWPSGQREQK